MIDHNSQNNLSIFFVIEAIHEKTISVCFNYIENYDLIFLFIFCFVFCISLSAVSRILQIILQAQCNHHSILYNSLLKNCNAIASHLHHVWLRLFGKCVQQCYAVGVLWAAAPIGLQAVPGFPTLELWILTNLPYHVLAAIHVKILELISIICRNTYEIICGMHLENILSIGSNKSHVYFWGHLRHYSLPWLLHADLCAWVITETVHDSILAEGYWEILATSNGNNFDLVVWYCDPLLLESLILAAQIRVF